MQFVSGFFIDKRILYYHSSVKVRYSFSNDYPNNCAAWFLVSTFSMSWIKIPCSSKTNVLRKVPTHVLPHIFFSPHAPNACNISVDGSESKGKGKSYLAMKF